VGTAQRGKAMNETEEKVEFMKAHGFSENPDADWLNQTQKIWVSHEVVADSSLSELTEKIRMDVPAGEFHFYSKRPISQPFCITTVQRLNLPNLKPVNHAWA
jgi:hypothetical protein